MINIITRYSRDKGLKKTVSSINKQNLNEEITHFITYEEKIPIAKDYEFLKNTVFVKVPKMQIINNLSLYYHHNDYHTDYVNFNLNKDCFYYYNTTKPDVEKIKYPVKKFESNGAWCLTLEESIIPHCEHFPPNIYLKIVEEKIKDGWILYLDDGDIFEEDNSLIKLIEEIKRYDEDTLHIFKIMNRGRAFTTPREGIWKTHYKIGHPLILGEISGSCITFHSKWKEYTKWDEFRNADYRTARSLETMIPKKNLFNDIIIYTP